MSNQLNIFQEINKNVLEKERVREVIKEVYYNTKGEPLPWEEEQAKTKKKIASHNKIGTDCPIDNSLNL